MVSASASTITGRSVSRANHSAAAPASSVPSPGPTTQACTRPAELAVDVAMTSGQCETTSAAAVPAYRTMPDVAATAAPVHRIAAPGYVADPAITPVTPWVYLSSLAAGIGQRARTSAGSSEH